MPIKRQLPTQSGNGTEINGGQMAQEKDRIAKMSSDQTQNKHNIQETAIEKTNKNSNLYYHSKTVFRRNA